MLNIHFLEKILLFHPSHTLRECILSMLINFPQKGLFTCTALLLIPQRTVGPLMSIHNAYWNNWSKIALACVQGGPFFFHRTFRLYLCQFRNCQFGDRKLNVCVYYYLQLKLFTIYKNILNKIFYFDITDHYNRVSLE